MGEERAGLEVHCDRSQRFSAEVRGEHRQLVVWRWTNEDVERIAPVPSRHPLSYGTGCGDLAGHPAAQLAGATGWRSRRRNQLCARRRRSSPRWCDGSSGRGVPGGSAGGPGPYGHGTAVWPTRRRSGSGFGPRARKRQGKDQGTASEIRGADRQLCARLDRTKAAGYTDGRQSRSPRSPRSCPFWSARKAPAGRDSRLRPVGCQESLRGCYRAARLVGSPTS